MTMPLPPRWASNTNYSAGPDTGSPTKVDPASQADGYIRGVAAAAQQVNFVVHPLADAARRAFALAACKLRRVDLEGTAITDTAESMAAAQFTSITPLVALKTAQALAIGDGSRFVVAGVPTQITSLVTDAAVVRSSGGTKDGQIVVIGTGGKAHSFSNDAGATWAAANNSLATVGAGARVICEGGAAQVLAVGRPGSATISVVSSLFTGSNWSTVATGLTGVQGLAPWLDGAAHRMVLLDTVVPVAFMHGNSGSLVAAAGTVPNAATFDDAGSIDAAQNVAGVYHCGRRSSGTLLQVSYSVDADTWSQIASISAPTGAGFFAPRIMICENSGLLVIVAPLTTGQTALYASLDGADWTDPLFLATSPGLDAFSVAGGKVFAAYDDMLFASDGIGF